MVRDLLFHPGRSIPALALPLLMAAVLAPEPAGAQTVNGNSKAGPLTTHIYTLRTAYPS